MRKYFIISAFLTFGAGCTHSALERRTIKQAGTISDLQHEQVLNNLAAFACNPEALPYHVKLKGGTVQVVDQGTGGFEAALATLDMAHVLTPGGTAGRTVLGQWDVDPTAEADELELLALAYRKALDPANPDVQRQIYDRIGELSVRFDILPQPQSRAEIFRLNDAAGKIAKRRGELQGEIAQTVTAQAALLEQSKVGDVEKAKKGAKDKLKEAKNAEEREKALRALVDAEQRERHYDYLGWRRGQLTNEALQLVEMERLVTLDTAPEPTGSTPTSIGGRRFRTKTNDPEIYADLTSAARAEDQPAGQKTLLLAAIEMAIGSYVPSRELHEATQRNVGLVAQAEDKVRKLEELTEKFTTPWLTCGQKHQVPKCACYVGHHRGCKGDCYVWVMPDHLGKLREFTLIVLALAPIEKQDAPQIKLSGAAVNGASAFR